MTPEQLREAVNTVRHATDTEDATAAAARIYAAFEKLTKAAARALDEAESDLVDNAINTLRAVVRVRPSKHPV